MKIQLSFIKRHEHNDNTILVNISFARVASLHQHDDRGWGIDFLRVGGSVQSNDIMWKWCHHIGKSSGLGTKLYGTAIKPEFCPPNQIALMQCCWYDGITSAWYNYIVFSWPALDKPQNIGITIPYYRNSNTDVKLLTTSTTLLS